ncbi:hypothetical protein H8356DRAFT_1715179 [Neocallimastix lanati (nom. inval.)]|nr:hypothetical protein H8356DRAFT_1715179 [Neocallimastix sp. JGI-2020a]
MVFIKSLIVVAHIVIINILSFTGIALILLSHDAYLTFRSLVKTSIIRLNLKILYTFLLLICDIANFDLYLRQLFPFYF